MPRRAGEPGGPSMGGSRGPDLSRIGANKGRDAEWFAAWIRDPKSVKPEARLMPAFKDTLTEEQSANSPSGSPPRSSRIGGRVRNGSTPADAPPV